MTQPQFAGTELQWVTALSFQLWLCDVYDYDILSLYLIVFVRINWSFQTSSLLQQQNMVQEQCGQHDSRHQQIWSVCWWGVETHKAAVRVGASRVEGHKVNRCRAHLISDPLLELRHSSIDFRVIGRGTRYSETGYASLDPRRALFALQRPTWVTLCLLKEKKNYTWRKPEASCKEFDFHPWTLSFVKAG